MRAVRWSVVALCCYGFIAEASAHFNFRRPFIPRISALQVIAALDRDKDGKISLAEFLAPAANAPSTVQASLQACFTKLDKNSDGFLDSAELANRPAPVSVSELFTSLDTNADSKLSLAEFQAQTNTNLTAAQLQIVFTELDADADGFLTLAEFSNKPRRIIGTAFAKADTDADGKISLAEFLAICPKGGTRFTAAATALFKTLDTNADGYLSLAEFSVFSARR